MGREGDTVGGFHLGVLAKFGKLCIVELASDCLENVLAFLGCLFHLPCQKQTGRSHHPSVKLLETLEHEEAMKEHHSCGLRVS